MVRVTKDAEIRLYGDVNNSGTADGNDTVQIYRNATGKKSVFSIGNAETIAYRLIVNKGWDLAGAEQIINPVFTEKCISVNLAGGQALRTLLHHPLEFFFQHILCHILVFLFCVFTDSGLGRQCRNFLKIG